MSSPVMELCMELDSLVPDSDRLLLPEGHYYDGAKKEYLVPLPSGGWSEMTERQYIRELKRLGFQFNRGGSALSEVELALNAIQKTRLVDYLGPLAGHSAGVLKIGGKTILVKNSPSMIKPAPGDWSTLRRVIEGLLDGSDDGTQTPYFYAWCKLAISAVNGTAPRTGQAVILVGPRNCGKSLVQNIVTMLLGGRSARPYQFGLGDTQFNSDLFGAEHLMIEDDVPLNDQKASAALGSFIKRVAANEEHRLHAKHREPLVLRPIWRLTMSLNDEAANLRALPPMDDSMKDKLLLFRCSTPAEPFNDGSPEGRTAFMSKLRDELPAFLSFLQSWSIPRELQDSRFGMRAFIHPELGGNRLPADAAVQFLELIQSSFPFGDGKPWVGTAQALVEVLASRVAAGSCGNLPRAPGLLLGKLADSHPQLVARAPRRSDVREWMIYPLRQANQT